MSAQRRFSVCKDCGRGHAETGGISATGLCPSCGERRMSANLRALIFHSGPEFEHWRRRLAASVGAAHVDAAPAAE